MEEKEKKENRQRHMIDERRRTSLGRKNIHQDLETLDELRHFQKVPPAERVMTGKDLFMKKVQSILGFWSCPFSWTGSFKESLLLDFSASDPHILKARKDK